VSVVVAEFNIEGFSFELTMDVTDEARETADRAVKALGCTECQTMSITGPHICEHGVTNPPPAEVTVEVELCADDYIRLMGWM
jgi:hypothetical protein